MKIETHDFRGSRLKIGEDGKRIFFDFDYDPKLVAEVKQMQGAVWYGHANANLTEYVTEHFGHTKLWSVKDNERNQWALSYLLGGDPYAWYKKPIVEYDYGRFPLKPYQQVQADFVVNRRRCMLACDMGLGKTLSVIAAWEYLKPNGLIYVSDGGVLKNTKQQEFPRWKPEILPDEMVTYSSLHKVDSVPQMVVFDEAHALKGGTTARTKAAAKLARRMREQWGNDAYIVAMTGTAAPQDPTDWYSILEIICPGYIAEGDVHKFRRRLAVLHTVDFGNGPVQQVRTWKDREGLPWCSECGHEKHEHPVKKGLSPYKDCRAWRECKNEVALLNKRLSNKLVLYQKFEDHCELPPLRHKIIQCEPLQEHIDVAKGMAAVVVNGADMLNKCRQISDGGYYEESVVGEEECQDCGGTGEGVGVVPVSEELPPLTKGQSIDEYMSLYYTEAAVPCDLCSGTGMSPKIARTFVPLETPSPKLHELAKLFDQHLKYKRLVVYAAFQFSVDLCKQVAEDCGWDWIQADGRGWKTSLPFDGKAEFLNIFQDVDTYDMPIGFIAQPGAAGSGLTLHASPSIVNLSMTHNTKDAVQTRKRIHRMGSPHKEMTIYHLYNMPTDKLVHDAVRLKEARMDLSNGVDIDMREIMRALG